MIKMILSLPRRIDEEKFCDLVKDVLRGRYGKHSRYDGLWLYFEPVWCPQQESTAFSAGFSGKGTLNYFEIDADALDPVIIATIDEVMNFIDGANYSFVSEKKILPRDWWSSSYKSVRTVNGEKRNYDYDEVRDDYKRLLALLNGMTKSASGSHYEFTDEECNIARQILT